MTKYIFITGGVVSSLGKGIIGASLGKLLRARGYSVAIQKFDPYINVDPGTMSQNYQNNVSIWLEAAKEQLEAEQDAALAPLEMEQTDMELEKESVETQLAYAKERLQSIEQACNEETKNAAPKFGLG